MKRSDIEKALKALGVEIPQDKEKEAIDNIMSVYGADVEEAKKIPQKANEDLINLQNELAKYKEGGELYVDKSKFDELAKFKVDTEAKAVETARSNQLNKLFEKGKFDKEAYELLALKAQKLNPQFNENNEITNADDILKTLTTENAKYIVAEQTGGAKPSTPPPAKTEELDPFLKGLNL